MNTKAVAVLAMVTLMGATFPCSASEGKPGGLEVAADALVVRPLSLASTVIGSALFVVALPVAAISKSVRPTADALVNRPAWNTFSRPLGDLDAMADGPGTEADGESEPVTAAEGEGKFSEVDPADLE